MAGAGKKSGGGARTRKRVEATENAVLKRARDGSAFTRCEACGKSVSVALIDMHNCSLDDKIRIDLEAQVVEQAVEVTKKPPGKKKNNKDGDGGAKRKGKRPPTAFFLFMADFRKEYNKADKKSVSTAAKEGGERWNSMSDEEKKPYIDKAAQLKAEYNNGERSDENNVGGGDKAAGEQEIDQPPKKGADDDDDDEREGEKNELDDDI